MNGVKYSYFSAERSGKVHFHYSALLNGKSVARPKENCGNACTIHNPKNNSIEWYWVDKEENIRWLREYRNYTDIDWSGTIEDNKLPLKENLKSKHWLARGYTNTGLIFPEIHDNCMWFSNNYYKIFKKFFECDYLLHPDILLGYWGYTKADKKGLNLSECLLKDIRPMYVDLDYSIDQIKKRKNVIVYKDDIRRMARLWFLGGGQMIDMDDETYYNNISLRINEARIYPTCMQIALDRYDIPYEMWSLDKGDYSMFGFEKNLDRYVTEGTDTILKTEHHSKVEGWIDRYIGEFNEV